MGDEQEKERDIARIKDTIANHKEVNRSFVSVTGGTIELLVAEIANLTVKTDKMTARLVVLEAKP